VQELCHSFKTTRIQSGSGIGIDLRACFTRIYGIKRAAPASADRIHFGNTRIVIHSRSIAGSDDRCGEKVAGREERRPPIVAGAPAPAHCRGKRANSIWVASGISVPEVDSVRVALAVSRQATPPPPSSLSLLQPRNLVCSAARVGACASIHPSSRSGGPRPAFGWF
jgi:hypothetical protein